jgi:hypothetical protein
MSPSSQARTDRGCRRRRKHAQTADGAVVASTNKSPSPSFQEFSLVLVVVLPLNIFLVLQKGPQKNETRCFGEFG